MRRTFEEALKLGAIDIGSEYAKMYELVFEWRHTPTSQTLREIINDRFLDIPFRGTCLRLQEFEIKHALAFERWPRDVSVDYLVSFCEYYENMLHTLSIYDPLFEMQLNNLMDALCYKKIISDNGFSIYVEKSSAAIAVAESTQIPDELSYKVLEYNHRSLKGNIEKKRELLTLFSSQLEPKRKTLAGVAKSLSDALFFSFNNMNIRHNNIDPSDKAKYVKEVAEIDSKVLEEWYDEIYQMCLLAFLELEQIERKKKFDKLKNEIETSK